MVKKVSFKLFIVLSLLFGTFYACIEPVNITAFFESPEVKIIVETADNNRKPDSTVKLAQGSEGTAGDGKITGIIPGKYYKVEELDEDGNMEHIYYVTGSGTPSADLKDIRKIPDTVNSITGLTNDVTYMVKSADFYTNPEGIKYFVLTESTPAPSKPAATVTSGAVTIRENRMSTSQKCWFNLTAATSPKISSTGDYEVMKINISGDSSSTWQDGYTSAYRKTGNGLDGDSSPAGSGPVSSITPAVDDTSYKPFRGLLHIGIYQFRTDKYNVTSPSFLNGMSIMELPAQNTETDYIFVEFINNGNTISNFYVLTVKVRPPGGYGTITITPPVKPNNETITLTYSAGNIDDGQRITILLSDMNKTIAVTNTDTTACTYKWYKDEDSTPQSWSGSSIIISSTAGLTGTGIYKITVEVTIGGVDYSKWFILEIK